MEKRLPVYRTVGSHTASIPTMLHRQRSSLPRAFIRFASLLWFASIIFVIPHTTIAQVDGWIQENSTTRLDANDERMNYLQSLLEYQQTDQEVLDMLENVIESGFPSSQDDECTFLYAQALQAKGRAKQAIIILEQFLDTYPLSSLINDVQLLLGRLYIESRQTNRAITVLTQALNQSFIPVIQTESMNRLRQAYELQGEYTKAIQMAIKQMKKTTEAEREELLDDIQRLILQKMDKRSLKTLLVTFSTTFPGDLALLRLIELHTAQGDEVVAEQHIREFLHRFPNHLDTQTVVALRQSFFSKIKTHQYVIAAILPFSGKMKPFGTDALNGIRLALKEGKAYLGSNTLGLVVKDSARFPSQLHHEFKQVLKEFEPIALIGPLLARQVQHVADLPDWAEIPFITPAATLSEVNQFGRFWFSTALTTRAQVIKLLDHAMRTLRHTRFCVLSPQSPYGNELAQIFVETVIHNGGEIIAVEMYERGTTDASVQIQRLTNMDLSRYGEMRFLETLESQKEGKKHYAPGFDALFLPGHPTDVAFLSAQLAFYDVKVPLLGNNSWNHPDLLKWGRTTLKGGIFGDALFLHSPDPEMQEFIRNYREQFQLDPSIFAAQAYDAMRVVLDTINHGATTAQEVRDQLFSRYDFPTLGGLASFDKGGVLDRKVYMIQVSNGRFVQIN